MPPRAAVAHGPRLALSEDDVFRDFADTVDLSGAVVAEVGGSFPVELLQWHGVAKWYAVDPHREPSTDAGGLREVLRRRAEEMPLPDASVDAVFSCNAFQFVDVRAVLAQARRVL